MRTIEDSARRSSQFSAGLRIFLGWHSFLSFWRSFLGLQQFSVVFRSLLQFFVVSRGFVASSHSLSRFSHFRRIFRKCRSLFLAFADFTVFVVVFVVSRRSGNLAQFELCSDWGSFRIVCCLRQSSVIRRIGGAFRPGVGGDR